MDRSLAEIVDACIEANETELPVLDQTAMRVHELTQSDDYDAASLESLIREEPVLTAAVLRLANSSFYGGLSQITSVRDAIVRLGSQKVSSVVIAVTQRESYKMRDPGLQAVLSKLWHHSITCALGSAWLADRLDRKDLTDHAFMAGMLHDLGKLLILRVVDDLKVSEADFDPPMPLVHQILDAMHADRGAMLMAKWNIPQVYADVVARHHDPNFGDDETLLLLVRLVDLACNKIGVGVQEKPDTKVAASAEAQVLGVSDVMAAELEILLEDASGVAGLV